MGSTEAATLLESLPPRPPTPPRDAAHDAGLVAKTNNAVLPPARPPVLGARTNIQTPPSLFTPDSSNANSTNPSRSRKRVGFSAQAEYKEAPDYTHASRRSSPPSATQPRPVKGILKPPSASDNRELTLLSDNPEADSVSIADMLESALKQLAGANRDAKIDAYMMIVRALQASKNLPDRIALRDKMTLFLHFIQRDITAKNAAGTLDIPLIAKALSLLDTFLFFPAISSTIPSDFGVFIIEHCIKTFEDEACSKDMARRLMHVVATQDFSQRVWTSDRVRRLVAALHGMRLEGKSPNVYRLRAYHRLIHKAQHYMIVHTQWLNDIFTDMLDKSKDIRNSAIKLGYEAAYVYGKEPQLSRRVLELLDASIEEKTYIEWYREQLLAMTKSKVSDHRAIVPEIWGVIVLLLRISLCRWRFFNPWLHLIQNCFNSSDVECNKQANFAWNRFVYTLHFDERNFSSPKMFATLLQPIAVQLRKAGISDEKRKIVFGGLCNLYYYAFRPNASAAQLDMFWEVSVKPLTDTMVPTKNSAKVIDDHFKRVSVILTRFFGAKSPPWREDRIKESEFPEPEELPMIDPKWVRRNAPSIFSVMNPIMDRYFLELSDETSIVHDLWDSLVTSVGLAASKEIKVSNDTAAFISEALGLLLRHWQVGVPEGDSSKSEQFLLAVQTVVLSIVDKLGVLPFTERMLSLGRMSSFMPVSTPSHRPGKNLGDVRTPLQHMFGLLTRLPPGIPDDETYLLFLRSILSPFFTTSKSAKARSDLACEMLASVPIWSPQTSHYPYGPWVFVSENVMSAMSASQTSIPSSGDALLGHEYRAILRLLERGWRETPNLPWEQWQSLYLALVNRATEEAGEAGRALGVVESMAKMIRESLATSNSEVPSSTLKVTTELVSTATQPRDRQALDAARRRIWGGPATGPKVASFDPYDHFYKLVDEVLTRLYDASTESEINPGVTALLVETSAFLSRSNSQLVKKSISNLENGISAWVKDGHGIMSSRRDAEQADAAKQLWVVVCGIIFSDAQPQLDTFEKLLCAAFVSKHRQVVNIVAQAWNAKFEAVEHLEYPDHLKAVLLSSQTFVDLALPGLAAPPTPSDAQGRSFVESQEAPREISLASSRSLRRSLAPSSAKSTRSASPTVAAAKLNASAKKRTPRSVRSSARSTPTSRLRHDNSQLHFVPVESSPLAQQADSQNLTEHQKEVRTRQKEAATIYPELRTSPRRKAKEASRQQAASPEKPTEQQKESTPEPRGSFEDYVASTPTPRRGQALMLDLDDHDMTDPPSSPPEPRPFPLLPQIKSRSSSRGEMDNDWPLSSSPVNSPTVEAAQPVEDEDVPDMDIADEPIPTTEASPAIVEDSFPMEEPEPEAETLLEDSILEIDPELPPLIPSTVEEEPSTPRHRDAEAEDAGVAQDVFVDALSSPPSSARLRRSSRRVEEANGAKDSSFVMSDGDERSMLRLVVELDSRKSCALPLSDRPAESPPKRENPTDVEDCITVAPSPKKRTRKSSKSKSPSVSVIGEEEAEADQSAPAEKTSSSRKKRKRSTSSKQERRKKRKSSDESADESSQLASSQSSVAGTSSPYWSEAEGDQTEPAETDAQAEDAPAPAEEPPSPAHSEGKDTDTELESQLVAEQQAASLSQQSQAAAVAAAAAEAVPEITEDPERMDVDAAADAPVVAAEDRSIMEELTSVLGKLQSAALPRDEVHRMEDMLMDIKRALYAAEERGRRPSP